MGSKTTHGAASCDQRDDGEGQHSNPVNRRAKVESQEVSQRDWGAHQKTPGEGNMDYETMSYQVEHSNDLIPSRLSTKSESERESPMSQERIDDEVNKVGTKILKELQTAQGAHPRIPDTKLQRPQPALGGTSKRM